ncbi:MAG: hypothetical protein CM1200mP29_08700 [Verrucomicrobiota bacterium]|nr:MAG: hypothetical protein CM1200mP29_08700 [Verrucomicrobiota bacterium]
MLTNLRNAQVIEFIKDEATQWITKSMGCQPWLSLKVNGVSADPGQWRELIAFGTVDTCVLPPGPTMSQRLSASRASRQSCCRKRHSSYESAGCGPSRLTKSPPLP